MHIDYTVNSKPFDFHFIDYSFQTQEFFLVEEKNYRSLEIDAGRPFDPWSGVMTTIGELCYEGFDRPVDYVIVEDETCVFLRDRRNWTRADYDEWIKEGKCVFDHHDIRRSVPLPKHVKFEDVIFVLFFETGDDDDEELIFQWGSFVPSA